MKSDDKFYTSKKWLHEREMVLKRDGYMDQVQKRYRALPDQADTVHHIFPRDLFPEFQWCRWNLISISSATHAMLHDRVSRRLTKAGLDLMIRTGRKAGLKNLDELVSRETSLQQKTGCASHQSRKIEKDFHH